MTLNTLKSRQDNFWITYPIFSSEKLQKRKEMWLNYERWMYHKLSDLKHSRLLVHWGGTAKSLKSGCLGFWNHENLWPYSHVVSPAENGHDIHEASANSLNSLGWNILWPK